MLANLARDNRLCICGLPGSGKTTLTRHICSLLEPRVLIYDPLDQYRMFKDNNRYIPKSDSLVEFESVCRQLCATKNITFVVEEAERYLGQGKPLGPYAFDLCNRGRNWNVGVYAVTRRIQRISKDFFDLCQSIIFFKNGAKSRMYIRDLVGKEIAVWIYELERFHFLYYSLETEETIDGVLEIEGVREHIETRSMSGAEQPKEKE